MIPSRQQAAQGPYGPLLTAGLYPLPQSAAAAPAAPGAPVAATPAAQPVAQPIAAPAAPDTAPAPVSVGAVPVDGDLGESAPSMPSPDQSFGGFMNSLGTAASIGFGGPLGIAGALGSLVMSDAMGAAPTFNMATPALGDLFGGAAAENVSMDGGPGAEPGGDKGGTSADFSSDVGGIGLSTGDMGGDPDGGMASEGGTGPDGGDKGDGFMAGGYTGDGDDGAVDPMQEAGTVHEGEVVIPADMVKHYGLDLLMGLVNGSVPKNRLAQIAGIG